MDWEKVWILDLHYNVKCLWVVMITVNVCFSIAHK